MDDRLHPVVTAVTSGVVGVMIAAVTYGGAPPEGGVEATGLTTTTLAPASTGSSVHISVPLIDAFAIPPEVPGLPEVPVSSAPEPDDPKDAEDPSRTTTTKAAKSTSDEPAPPPPPPLPPPPPATTTTILPQRNPRPPLTSATTTTTADPGDNNKPGEPTTTTTQAPTTTTTTTTSTPTSLNSPVSISTPSTPLGG